MVMIRLCLVSIDDGLDEVMFRLILLDMIF